MILYEYAYGATDNTVAGGVQWRGQTFVATSTHKVHSVKLRFYKTAGSVGTLTVSIRATSGGLPTGSDLCVGSIDLSQVTATSAPGSFVEVNLGEGTTLTNGTTYAIVVRKVGTGNLYLRIGAGIYGSGILVTSSNSGGSWSPVSGWDAAFEVWFYEVVTTDASDLAKDSATGNAIVEDNSDIDQYGIEWGTTSGSYDDSNVVTGTPPLGTFSLSMSSLEPATVYYYRAKLHHTSSGWLYSRELAFVTAHDDALTQYENWWGETFSQTFYGAVWRAQTFTTTAGYQLKTIKLRLRKDASNYFDIGDVIVSIRATDAAHKPTGSDIDGITATFPSELLTTSLTTIEFNFGTGVVLSAGTEYAIVVRVPNGNASNYLYWGGKTFYPDGQAGYSSDSGSSWSMVANDDQVFDIYGNSGIETYEATNIRAFQVTGNGHFIDAENLDEIGFEWGTDQGGPYPSEVTIVSGSFFAGFYSLTMSGLDYSMDYYYRAKIHYDTLGWLYGNEVAFTTAEPYPIVVTASPDQVESTYVLSRGEITDIGGGSADVRGFVYGTTSKSDPGNVPPSSTGYDGYVSESGTFGTGEYILLISPLAPNTRYYVRAYAHNAYGYGYGDEVIIFTNTTVNILYPNSDILAGIRFDTSEGGGYPHPYGGSIPHWLLCRDDDSEYHKSAVWGYCTGNYVYERNYYNSNMYTDVYGLTNPHKRDEGVIKIKWKAHILGNAYPYGDYKRVLQTHSTTYYGDAHGAGPYTGTVCEIFYTNPFTSSGWTIAELDALGAGVSLGEGGGYGTPICDSVKVVVLWANAYARTDPANYLSPTSFRLNGYVEEDEAEACEVYFEWGVTSGYGSTTTAQSKAKGQSFSTDITASGVIHFRTVIETVCGETFYGSDRTTSAGAPVTLPFKGLFIRGDEIQVVFSASGFSAPYRSPDFGVTWYAMEGVDEVNTFDVAFDSKFPYNSVIGGDGYLYKAVTVSGQYYTYEQKAAIQGQTSRIMADVESTIAFIGTDEKLYKTNNWGEDVYEMFDGEVTDVAVGGNELSSYVPS